MMTMGKTNINADMSGRRLRKRIRGAFSGKAGKAAGIGSLAAPVVGLIIHDIRKPDSIIRNLLSHTARRLLKANTKEPKAIDITDKVEVIENKKNEQ